MAFDAHANFAYSTVATAPSPATSGTTVVVAAGDGAKFPAAPFNAVIWAANTQPLAANAEIVRVTAIAGDTLTITRAQETSTARAVVAGDQIVAGFTKKTLTDIENYLNGVTSGASLNAPVITGGSLSSAIVDTPTVRNWDGWEDGNIVPTYSSADAPTFVMNIPADVTAVLQPGDRIKLTQSATVKYFLVTAVGAFSAGNTPVTMYGGTDYTLANSAISAYFFSHDKSPFGFPLDPAKWSQTYSDNQIRSQASPTAGTWYNINSASLTIPIGKWRVYYSLMAIAARGATTAGMEVYTTLSTANNTQGSDAFTARLSNNAASLAELGGMIFREDSLSLASKTIYYLNTLSNTSSLNTLYNYGQTGATLIKAVCALL